MVHQRQNENKQHTTVSLTRESLKKFQWNHTMTSPPFSTNGLLHVHRVHVHHVHVRRHMILHREKHTHYKYTSTSKLILHTGILLKKHYIVITYYAYNKGLGFMRVVVHSSCKGKLHKHQTELQYIHYKQTLPSVDGGHTTQLQNC